jgi:hypothetical protein
MSTAKAGMKKIDNVVKTFKTAIHKLSAGIVVCETQIELNRSAVTEIERESAELNDCIDRAVKLQVGLEKLIGGT